MANTLPLLTSVFSIVLLLSSVTQAFDNYKEFKRDHWDFELGSQYFYSEANYTNMGTNTSSLGSGNHYQLWDVNFSTRYIPRKDWSVFAMGTVSNAESKNTLATRSNSTLSQALMGFDFVMYDEVLQLVPELAVLVPFQKVDGSGDAVLNSEGVFEGWARVTAQKDFGGFRGYGWLGFNYRGEGRSYLMPWGVGLQLKLKSFKVGGEVFGSQSITDDKDTNYKVNRQTYVNTVDAGSYKFYFPNPSIVDSQVYATWEIQPAWSLQVNGGATLAGENTAAGFHVGGFVRYSFDLAKGYSAPESESYKAIKNPVPSGKSNMYTTPDSEMSSERKVQKFREETNDGVDQSLFKPTPTKKAKTVDDELKQQLNDTEFQVELQGQKKKRRKK